MRPGGAPEWLHWTTRRHNGKVYLLAVNDGDGEGRVRFNLPGNATDVREFSTDRRITVQEGVIEDTFTPLAVHLYEIAPRR